MGKLEEILKAEGYTDADLEAVKPLLSDERFRRSVEHSIAETEGTLEKFRKENTAWAEWHEKEGKPILDMYEKDMTDARAESAALKERLRLAEAAGFAPKSGDPPAATPPAATTATPPASFDPKQHKLVTYDDVAKFSDLEAEAIAMAGDLQQEYQALVGKQLFDYRYRNGDQELNGLKALRTEAKNANWRGSLRDFAAQKFDFAGKRQAIEDKRRADAEEAIRADERAKMAAKYGNPELRQLVPSREPFLPRAEKDQKHPWEREPQERRRDRLEHLTRLQMTGPTQ